MCGRFALFASEQQILSHFHAEKGFSMRARYNIAPTQTIPIVKNGAKQVDFCRWGFIPAWAKADMQNTDGLPLAHINARLESLHEKPTFKTAFQKQRCLIPASGYYEWRTIANRKQPYFIYLKEEPLFAFAGIWSTWRAPDGQEIATCAIITIEAPDFLQKIHQRMPAIISPRHYKNWLSQSGKENPQTMLISLEESRVDLRAVTPRMNHPRFEGIECIQGL